MATAKPSKTIQGQYADPPGGLPFRAEDSGLIYYWRLLRGHKGNLLVCAFLGGVAGFLIVLPQAKVYRAHGSMEIHDAGSAGPDFLASDAFLQTQMRLLQSKTLTDRVLEKMKRAGQLDPAAGAGPLAAWKKVLDLQPEDAASASQRMAVELTNSLSVRTAGQTRIAEIYADSSNPRAAASFVNTLSAEFIQESTRASAPPQNTGTDQAQARLRDAEARLRENERQAVAAPAIAAAQDLQQGQQELAAARGDRAAKQARYNLLRNAPADSLADAVADPALRETFAKLVEFRRQLTELNEKFTPQHPRVLATQDQVARLQAGFEAQRKALIERTRAEYEEALALEKQLSETYATQLRAGGQDSNQAAHTALLREVESARQLYEQSLQRAQLIPPAAATPGVSRVVDPAEVPLVPYKPSAAQNVVFGMLGGVLLGIVLLALREQTNRTIQHPGDVANGFQLPELGAVPPAGRGRTGRYKDPARGSAGPPAIPAISRPEFILSNQSAFGFGEAIRSVLLSIVYAGDSGEARRVLAFTSPSPGEGKTTVASNVAMAFAGLNRRVLLIDGDLRRSRLHDLFGISRKPGLSELLEGRISLDDPATGVIRESVVKNLFVLPSGAPTDESAVLLHEKGLGELLAVLRGQFDTIILDTPPVLLIPDARVMGRLADSVVVVVRAGKTTSDALGATRERLTQDGVSLLGVILNDWDPRKAAAADYGSYGSYGSYRPADTAKAGEGKR